MDGCIYTGVTGSVKDGSMAAVADQVFTKLGEVMTKACYGCHKRVLYYSNMMSQ